MTKIKGMLTIGVILLFLGVIVNPATAQVTIQEKVQEKIDSMKVSKVQQLQLTRDELLSMHKFLPDLIEKISKASSRANLVDIVQSFIAENGRHPVLVEVVAAVGDGAAAVIIAPATSFRLSGSSQNGRRPVTIIASAAAADTLAVHSRRDPLWLTAAEKSALDPYSQAGVMPPDIDIFELHDAFSIMSALSLEACGFAERGQGPRMGLDGEITLDGRIPSSTRGGLKDRGHPVGATGIYQIVEVVQQLRGEAGLTQVNNARIGIAQNIGGSGATIITHILRAG